MNKCVSWIWAGALSRLIGCRQHHIQVLKMTLYKVTGVCNSAAPPAQGSLQPLLSQASLRRDCVVLISQGKKKKRLSNHCLTWSREGISRFSVRPFSCQSPNVLDQRGQNADPGTKCSGVMWLLFPISFSCPSQWSYAHPALGWAGSAGTQSMAGTLGKTRCRVLGTGL